MSKEKEIIPSLITLFVLISCSSDPATQNPDTDSNDTSSDSESNGDEDTSNSDTDTNTNDTETGTETAETYTCEAPASCVSTFICNALFNRTPVSGKTCPAGQTCCQSDGQSTGDNRPFCASGGEGYDCVSNRQCTESNGTVDDSYKCANTNYVCCHTDDSPDTSSETETETVAECPGAYECTSSSECTTPDVVHDEFTCSGSLVCCEQKSIDAGLTDGGLMDGGN